ncbi:MAG: hypothetical protein NTNFB02_24170 [Nitrospira sp.]
MKRLQVTRTGAHLRVPPDPSLKPHRHPYYLLVMIFVILGFDGPDGEARRKIHRPAHLANLEPLDQAGRVLLAGPLTDKTGSLIVIEADSLEEARKFALEDPYTVNGVFERVEVHPFVQVFPKPR